MTRQVRRAQERQAVKMRSQSYPRNIKARGFTGRIRKNRKWRGDGQDYFS